MKKITWSTPEGDERTGVLWSPGPTEASVWVIPDERREGEGYAVEVGKNGQQNRNHVTRSKQGHQVGVEAALQGRLPVSGLRMRNRWGFIEDVHQYLAPRDALATSMGSRDYVLDLFRE